MSRIHAAIVAVLVTAAVAFGVTTAFEASARTEAAPDLERATTALQDRAARINQEEERLAKLLRDNPEVDRTPITRVIRVARPVSVSSRSTSSAPAAAPAYRDDDDERDVEGGDDHDDDGDHDDGGDDD